MRPGGSERAGVDLSPRGVATVLAVAIAGLLLADVLTLVSTYAFGHGTAKGLVPLFDMDAEQNVPSFFSATLFVAGSCGFFLLQRLDSSSAREGNQWRVLAVVFALLALDEAIAIHERLIVPLREMIGASGAFYFTWVIPYALAVCVLAAYVLPRLLQVPRAVRRIFFAAAFTYLLGALGFELVGGVYAERLGMDTLTFDLLAMVEETLEMAGLATLLYAQMRLLVVDSGEFSIRFSS